MRGTTRFAFAFLALAGGCDTQLTAQPIDGGQPPTDGASPDAEVVCTREPQESPLPYSDIDDFDRSGCELGSLFMVDPVGVWHLQTINDFDDDPLRSTSYDVLSFTRLNGCLEARFDGWLTRDVTETLDDLLVRLQFRDDGRVFEWHVRDLCRSEDAGRLSGRFANCFQFGAEDPPSCVGGTVSAVRVERRPGETDGEGLSLLGTWHGSAVAPWPDVPTRAVRARGDVAYVAQREGGLHVVDVADPAAMRDLATRPVTSPDEWYVGVETVEGPEGPFALMLSDYRGLVVFDVAQPAAPVEVGAFPPPGESGIVFGRALAVVQVGVQQRAYLVRGIDWYSEGVFVDVFDVTDPSAPALLGSYRLDMVSPYDVSGASAFGTRLYVNLYRGLLVLDAADPWSPVAVSDLGWEQVGHSHSSAIVELGGCIHALVGDQDFGGHLVIAGVDEACPPSYQQIVGEFELRPEVSVDQIRVVGTKAYVAHLQDGVRVVEVSDPTAPQQVAYYNTWIGGPGDEFAEGARDLDVDPARGRVYVADSGRGLVILQEP